MSTTQDDDEHVPYAFHVALPEDTAKPNAPTRIVVSKSIEDDVLGHPSHAFSEEDILIIRCAPQSVFKVRPATRCSTTLSGTLHWHHDRSQGFPKPQLIHGVPQATYHRSCVLPSPLPVLFSRQGPVIRMSDYGT